MSISPICYVNNAPIPVNPTTGQTGFVATSGQTITITLANPAGVNVWNINCTETDGFNPNSTVALVQATKLQTGYSCTFTVPVSITDGYIGSSLQFTSNVNNVAGQTVTFGVFVENYDSSRLFFPNENLETNLVTGVVYDLNQLKASQITGAIILEGDVTGSSSHNIVESIQGVVISGTPQDGYVLTATSPTAASWQVPGDEPISGATYIYVDDYVFASIAGGLAHGASTTSGSSTITLNNNAGPFKFTAGMVGYNISCTGVPVTGGTYATISTYVSPTQVTVSRNATSTQTLAQVVVMSGSQDDTAGINNAIAAASATKSVIVFGQRAYVYSSPISLNGTMGYLGQGPNQSFLIAKTPAASQTGDALYVTNMPQSFVATGLNIKGPGTQTPAYISQSVVSNGVITCTVANSETMDTNARIRLQGARGAAKAPLNWTSWTTTGTPTSSSFTAQALTWDGRVGVFNIANIAIASGQITVTTFGNHTMESAEQVYFNQVGTATFLTGAFVPLVSGTVSGSTTIVATAPSYKTTQVTNGGSTATYTGTFPSFPLAGTTLTFSGFSNSGNNGAFSVVSSTTSQVVVNNASSVNETPATAGSAQLTTYTSAADTGTVCYISDGTYTDNIAGIMDYAGLRVSCHPNQGSTITDHLMVYNNIVAGFKGDGFTLYQPNYGYFDQNQSVGCTGGLSCQSAYATTNRFTNPSCYSVRGSCQLYGSCFGLAVVRSGGFSIDMPGCNVSGIGILLDNCSGVHISSADCETQTPLSGLTDLYPGYCVEVSGGEGISISGCFLLVGNPSNTATQTMFYAWNNAANFSYTDSIHIGSSGFTQPTYEVLVDSTCSNYRIENVGTITGTSNNISCSGTNFFTNFVASPTYTISNSGGLTVQEQTASSAGSNHNSPAFILQDTYWNGSASAFGGFNIFSSPASGTNPIETFSITHTGSSGGSQFSWNGGQFLIAGNGNTTLPQTISATSSANENSPTLTFIGHYWNGSSSSSDNWVLQDIFSTGANPTAAFTITHTGVSDGYVQLTTPLALQGTSQAQTGDIRAENASTIIGARNAANSADIQVIGTIASNSIFVGDGINNNNVNLNVPSGNSINFQAGGTSSMTFSVTTAGANLITCEAASTSFGIQQNSIGTGTTAANFTIGAQSNTNTGSTGGNLLLDAGTGTTINGSVLLRYGTTVVGQFDPTDVIFPLASYLSMGTNPAASGIIRLPNNNSINFRNAANSASISTVAVSSANLVTIGDTTSDSGLKMVSSATLTFYPGDVLTMTMTGTQLQFANTVASPEIQVNTQTSDTATTSFTIKGQAAYASAVTNVNGGLMSVGGGDGYLGGGNSTGGSYDLRVGNGGNAYGQWNFQIGQADAVGTAYAMVPSFGPAAMNFECTSLMTSMLYEHLALGSTSAGSGTAGGNTTMQAQAGQAATGASNNGGTGGNLLLKAGVGGTSGSATAGIGGKVELLGGLIIQSITVTGSYTIDSNTTTADQCILVNSSGFATITLPAGSGNSGRSLRIKDISGTAGTNHITLSVTGGADIDGAASYVLNLNYAGVHLICNGTNWFVIGEYNGTVI